MVLHSIWRDCKAWAEEGLQMTTTSNEAAKMYDAVLTQYTGWYDDESVGGMDKCVDSMTQADPNFVMGHVLKVALDCVSTTTDMRAAESVAGLRACEQRGSVLPREASHIQALHAYCQGHLYKTMDLYEDHLMEYPTDVLAIKVVHDLHFYTGEHIRMRDTIASCLQSWKESQPLYGYLLGMYSFGLEETNLYRQAEKVARRGLEINPLDGWSTHSLAHVLEMEGRAAEGIVHLRGTESNWAKSNYLATHNYWHWMLYHLERGDNDDALGIYDANISKNIRSGSGTMLDIVDAASGLYRMELEGVRVADRWQDVYETVQHHLEDHQLGFNDVHLLMACMGADKSQGTGKLLQTLQAHAQSSGEALDKNTNRALTRELTLPLCRAMQEFSDGAFAQAVDLALPLRRRLVRLGGSHAQRDVFDQMLIHSCIASPTPRHQNIARSLLAEREALKPNSPLTQRLIAKALNEHSNQQDH